MMVNINTLVGSNPDFKNNVEFLTFLEIIYDLSLYSGMYFLTAIIVERCISVLFPTWCDNYLPKTLSVIMCVFLWILGCTESLIENLTCPSEDFRSQTPVCTGKTFRDQYPPRLYIIIIAAVFIFILSVIPFSFLWFLLYFRRLPSIQDILSLYFASIISAALSSTANPYIYFIVGRVWKQKSNNSIHDALHRAFKTEENEKEDLKCEK
ncbi:hypothetical protein XELAEV_18031597mg [Xenopus laevis]|uniref:G-protein coupled receptors family 1 profile domain-containing protein n=1 Tax=Xenopus laevis TaxID=8355 RepID=A0A974HFS3_XENLA|nr:hypothetical protein XELAEV_18031597mg [Xenopus laevis]